MAASALLRCLAEMSFQMFLAVAVFGAGGPMISVGAPLVIARLYKGKERATAMGLYVTGLYLGGLVALGLTNAVVLPLVGGSWRGVMVVYAGLVLASGAAWRLVSRGRVSYLSAAGNGKKFNLGAFKDILDVPAAFLILAMAVGVFFINHGFNNWMPEILRSYGFSAVAAGYWAALPPSIGILGVLFIPRLATPERRLFVMGGVRSCTCGQPAFAISTADILCDEADASRSGTRVDDDCGDHAADGDIWRARETAGSCRWAVFHLGRDRRGSSALLREC